jgi:hypothetical protein
LRMIVLPSLRLREVARRSYRNRDARVAQRPSPTPPVPLERSNPNC